MKKLVPFLFCCMAIQSKATTWNVNVQNNQFVPATLNVVVGDVIHWIWVAGGHTTTSTGVPTGAATWDAPMNSEDNTFDYTVTVAGTYDYWCTIHNVFMMASFVASGVAPVTLSAFNIGTQNNRPLLTWTTQTELNADHFSIRKSVNGSDFKEIGTVAAAGNSANRKNYSFSDEAISKGVHYVYYTLATIDKDGKTQLSPIKIYKNKNASPKIIISLSPNPISGMGHLMLRFNADKKSVLIAKLVDIQGKVVLQTELSAEEGINNGHIHLGNMPAGIYTLYLNLDGISESHRLVKN